MTPTGSTYLAMEVQGLRQLLADKDAEIAQLKDTSGRSIQLHDELDAEIGRLKADVEYWHHIATVEKNGLITELCDALELWKQTFGMPLEQQDLIQRAREATR